MVNVTKSIGLLQDIRSIVIKDGKQHLLYGKKGERVKLIAEHGNVIIAENSRGVRFPVGRGSVA